MSTATHPLGPVALNAYAECNSSFSEASQASRNKAADVVHWSETSQALYGKKAALIAELHELMRECAEPDWDGNDALPLDWYAFTRAVSLIRAFPDGVPLPECAPEPDGALSLDWIFTRYRMLSLSVGRDSQLAYAWMDGEARGHTCVRHDGLQVPARLLDDIGRLEKRSHAALRLA